MVVAARCLDAHLSLRALGLSLRVVRCWYLQRTSPNLSSANQCSPDPQRAGACSEEGALPMARPAPSSHDWLPAQVQECTPAVGGSQNKLPSLALLKSAKSTLAARPLNRTARRRSGSPSTPPGVTMASSEPRFCDSGPGAAAV